MTKSDQEVARLITWHIGFSVEIERNEVRELKEKIAELRQVLATLPATFMEPSDIENIRTVSGVLFPQLERALKASLQFTTWALLHDHFDDGYDLVYSPRRGKDFFSKWMEEQQHSLATTRSEDMTLGDLAASFGILGRHLAGLIRLADNRLRDRSSWPRSAKEKSSPFEFPFEHTVPYLDLDASNRESLRAALTNVEATFSRAQVASVRNKLLHDADEPPTREMIGDALHTIEMCVGQIVGHGLYPATFTPTESQHDKYGRRRYHLVSENGTEAMLTRPISAMLMGFPYVDETQLIVVGARLSIDTEPLRFAYSRDSEYSERWSVGFPKRPARRSLSASLVLEG